VRQLGAGRDAADVDLGVLCELEGAVVLGWCRGHDPQPPVGAVRGRELALLDRVLQPLLRRQDPELDEADRLVLGGVLLGVLRASAGEPHDLRGARFELAAVAERVLVAEPTRHDPRQRLDVRVGVHRPDLAGCDHVVVEHAQGSDPHAVGVVPAAEAEVPTGVEPATGLVVVLVRAADVVVHVTPLGRVARV
jgi:hypothetical protein